MSDTDKVAILIRALEASGSEREAKLARAILGESEVKAAPAPPADEEPAPEADGALTLADVKAMSEAEINARWNEVAAVMQGPA